MLGSFLKLSVNKVFCRDLPISELSSFIPSLSISLSTAPDARSKRTFEFVAHHERFTSKSNDDKNLISGLFKINAVVTVLSAFSPRDALLMGYRITQNIMYGNWKRCSLHHKDEKERTAKVGSLYEYFVVKQISKLGAYG